jgi:hypothetical protein
MNRLLTLTLALLIAVTSQQMAMARGIMTDASGQVIICTGEGTITISLDGQGTPIEGPAPAHICPDCTLTIADVSSDITWKDGLLVHIQTVLQIPVQEPQIAFVNINIHARGPPATV